MRSKVVLHPKKTQIEEKELETTCDICGKEIIGIDNFIDAGDKVVCSKKMFRNRYC